MNRRYNQPWVHNNEPNRSNNQVKTCDLPWIMTRFCLHLWKFARTLTRCIMGRVSSPPPGLVRSEHAHASYPGLFFRTPGFSPYMGREERRVQGLDYASNEWVSWVRQCRRKLSVDGNFVDRNLSTEVVAVDRRRKWKCPHHPSLLRLNKSAKKASMPLMPLQWVE